MRHLTTIVTFHVNFRCIMRRPFRGNFRGTMRYNKTKILRAMSLPLCVRDSFRSREMRKFRRSLYPAFVPAKTTSCIAKRMLQPVNYKVKFVFTGKEEYPVFLLV